MVKKLTRGQKAWANDVKTLKVSEKEMLFEQPPCSLSKALDNSLDRLEQRMIDYIDRIERILA